MTKPFDTINYKRPNLKTFVQTSKKYIANLSQSTTIADALTAIQKMNTLRKTFFTMATICEVRYSIDTRDAFYVGENEFFNNNLPYVEELKSEYFRTLINHTLRPELEKKLGHQIFALADQSLKTFSPEIIPLMQRENNLTTEYMKLMATAEFQFRGRKLNLSTIRAYESSTDRVTRREAMETKWKFYETNYEKIGGIFDNLVKTRTEIARTLGFKNFVELGYARLMRTDYNAADVATFREAVQKNIVPIASEIAKRQQNRIGVDKLCYFDEEFRFASGNPTPKGTPEDIIASAKKMYSELSPQTDAFFTTMLNNNLMDLVAKEGKHTGGYCTFLPNNKTPFIFSNFNGTSGDIDVLTHEAGHAFQMFESRNMPLFEYYYPTFEACEIHSMSMEFFTLPYMNLFFGDDTEKYHFAHLAAALQFIPYGVAVDEFQHIVYENPEFTTEQRCAEWKKIEKKYLPHKNYEGNSFLKKGTLWMRQNHIFNTPFYYIDYTLAQICAFQFWQADVKNHKSAWQKYVRLCKKGGSESFLKLVEIAGLKSPFDAKTIEKTIKHVKKELFSVDDAKF